MDGRNIALKMFPRDYEDVIFTSEMYIACGIAIILFLLIVWMIYKFYILYQDKTRNSERIFTNLIMVIFIFILSVAYPLVGAHQQMNEASYEKYRTFLEDYSTKEEMIKIKEEKINKQIIVKKMASKSKIYFQNDNTLRTIDSISCDTSFIYSDGKIYSYDVVLYAK